MTESGVRHEDNQELNLGFGRATNLAFELAATPAVFAGLGWLVDRAIGTHLVFMLAFLLFAVVGTFVKVWLRYDDEMRRLEAATPWGKARAAGSAPGILPSAPPTLKASPSWRRGLKRGTA